jgi:hypothetical protein
MPNLSYGSSSQRARLRATRGELSPDILASRTSDDDLNRSIEGGIAQASVAWSMSAMAALCSAIRTRTGSAANRRPRNCQR